MRSVLTKVLVFAGAFLLALAALALFYAPGQVKRTPLDTDSVTRLSGEALVYDGNKLVPTPVSATSTTVANSEDSSGEVVVFHNFSCLIRNVDGDARDCVPAEDPEKRLLSAGTDVFATDRKTGLAVNDFKGLPADAEEKSGLVNKFPFDTEKKTYPFWDSYVNQAVDANFEGVEKIDGLETYKFTTTVENGDIEIAGSQGKYDTEKTMWIDPVTGAIQDQEQHLVQKMGNGQVVIDLDFSFTDETVAANVKSAKDSGGRLALLTSTVPKVAGMLGLLALSAGFVLFLARGDARSTRPDDEDYVDSADVFGGDEVEMASRADLRAR